MVTYVSIIGSGAGADYATVQAWYTGERRSPSESDGDYSDGDIVIAKLQNADDGHTGTHPIQYSIFGALGDVWADSVDLTVIVSGTNPDRSEWSDPSCTLTQNSVLRSNNSNKTFKFENLDLYVANNSSYRFNNDLTPATAGDTFDVEWTNCRVYCPSSGSNISILQNYIDFSSLTQTVTVTNCQITPRRTFFRNNTNNAGTSSVLVCRNIGSTFSMPYQQASENCIYTATVKFGGNVVPFSGSLEVLVSGCLFDSPLDLPFVFGPQSQFGTTYYTSGNTVDFITSESAANLGAWADGRSNTTSAVTFNYGTAPGAGEVSFASAAFDYSTDLPNLPLYDDSNNLALGYVSNVTLPSTDLVGNDRGISPFDAGAFEFVDSGGVDVTAAFGNVYVRLH